MLRNIIGPILNFKTCFFVVLVFALFENYSSFRRENEIFRNKKMDQLLTLKRAKIGPIFNFTTYI